MFEKLNRMGARERIGLTVAAACVLAAAADRFVVRGIVQDLRDLDTEISTARGNLRYDLRVAQAEPQASQEFEAVKGRILAPPSPSGAIDQFKGDVDELARKSGLTLLTMEHREPRAQSFCDEYTLEIGSFEGSMSGLLSFLDALEHMTGLLRVSRMVLSPGKVEGTVKGSMVLTRVMLPPVQAVDESPAASI